MKIADLPTPCLMVDRTKVISNIIALGDCHG